MYNKASVIAIPSLWCATLKLNKHLNKIITSSI